jgi:non-ribosomal peptide synthetase component F
MLGLMLDGVTPVPAEFAARYRERGYWADQPLFEGFTGALARYADRVALVDDDGPVTYRELSERSARLARVLLDLGFGPLDRIVVQLPNTAVFAYLYFALQRIGAALVLALPGHRKRAITQFTEISGARALAVPAAARGFDFTAMAAEIMASNPGLGWRLVQGADGPLPDPRFLLSGGTTGIPKRGGGGEPHPGPPGRAQRGVRALPRSGARRADVRLPGAAARPLTIPGGARDVPARLRDRHVQIARTSGVLRHLAAISGFGKVPKKELTAQLAGGPVS